MTSLQNSLKLHSLNRDMDTKIETTREDFFFSLSSIKRHDVKMLNAKNGL